MRISTFTSSFVLGHAFVLAIVSAILVFGFDYYEKIYGKDISFQISLWFVVLGALITGVGFGIGVSVSGWVAKYWVGVVAGGIFAGIIIGLSTLVGHITLSTGVRQLIVFTTWFFGSLIIPIAMSKKFGLKNG
jgi:hypothetical protein